MALSVNFPAGFNRLNPIPLDVSAVFDDMPAFTAYLAGGTAYPGQIVAVRTTNVPSLYVVNEDFTYGLLEAGQASLGMFWFELDAGDYLYFVTEAIGVANPFEFDDTTGNLYFVGA